MKRHNGGIGGSGRKYHCSKRGRMPSHYPEHSGPEMPTLKELRDRQTKDWWLDMHPAIRANLERFYGKGKAA